MEHQIRRQDLFMQGYHITAGAMTGIFSSRYGIDLTYQATFELLGYPEGRNILLQYYTSYLYLARKFRLPYLLSTPTWRANGDWGFKLGYTEREVQDLNRKAVSLVREIKCTMSGGGSRIILSGAIGPRNKTYRMTSAQAAAYHLPQIRTLAAEGIDLLTGFGLSYTDEAAGIIQAARSLGLSVLISFTIGADGRLADGEELPGAIERVDRLTAGYANYFLIDCADPLSIIAVMQETGAWKNRIGGLRLQTEGDGYAAPDSGESHRLVEGLSALIRQLPNVRIIGAGPQQLESICMAIPSPQ